MSIPAGTQFGRYEVRASLGAGGMGEVYLAEDTQLERAVALKLLPPQFTKDEDRLRRFKQEARATSALNHPNIITIYEIGTTDSGAYFIATEFIDGTTLRHQMQTARMKLDQALDVAVQVAAALAAAHEAGIVHRDIKPENIMLRRDRYVKVLDFGLAKLAERSSINPKAVTLAETNPGVVMGTVTYMSPEQARGLKVDERTDIFSLGVVLYECIAGRVPFTGATSSDMIVSILEREPQPLVRYLPGTPSELQRIVSKALAKERDGRYQTVTEMMADLSRMKRRLESESDWDYRTAPPESTASAALHRTLPYAEERDTRVQRNADETTRVLREDSNQGASEDQPTIIGAVIAPDGSSVGSTYNQLNSLAVLPLVNAGNDAGAEYLSDGITESIINTLSQLPQLKVMARSTVFRYKGRETLDAQEVGRELGVRAVLMGRVLQLGEQLIIKTELVDTRDGSQLWGAQFNRKPSDILAVQEEISTEISEKLRIKLTGSQVYLLTRRYTEDTHAYQLYLKGRYYLSKVTKEGLKKGIDYFQQAIDLDPSYALAYAGLSDAYYGLSSAHMPPVEAMPKARAAAMKALELDERLAEAHASLGLVKAFYDWDWSGAETEYTRAIELNRGNASAHHRYGWYLALMGRGTEAIREIRLAQESDPLSLEINVDLGLSFFLARQYDEAIEQFTKAIEMDRTFIWGRFFLGWAYEQKGMYEKAVEEYSEAAHQDDAPMIRAAIGHAYALDGGATGARKVLEQLKELSKQRHVSPYDFTILHVGLDEIDEAFAWLEKAYETRAEALAWLKVDPRLDPLRADPRFTDLLQRVGLE